MAGKEVLLTIGHSTHSLKLFIELLRKHSISAVADVRSSPYSRYCPQFNKEALSRSLGDIGIKYVFMGRELGGRADDPSCYVNGRVQYSRLARRQPFRDGTDRIRRGVSNHRIVLMCAEREPLECHRTLLVSRALDGEDLKIEHIHADGRLESHKKAIERLFDIVGLLRKDLFRSKEDLLSEAFARQEERVAYQHESLDTGGAGNLP